ncbi:MAG: protein kinase [Candidatus Eisenbacteria bacterium]
MSQASSFGDPLIGKTLSHYRIVEKIGAGGMGEVYRALDLRLTRDVAIKLLSPDAAGDRTATERLLREAQAVSALHHPNVVAIHGVEEIDGAPVIVMEYVTGETLATIVSRDPLPFACILDIGGQVADALEAAHAAHLVHRDIKPSNIILTPEGQAKVLDFGLAKRVAPSTSVADESTISTQLTGSGMIVGTVAYMSPEQTRGERVDHRTDIFSLGCILYELATGRQPFRAPSTVAMFHEIATQEPDPPSALRADLPYDFDLVIARSLSKDCQRRYPTARDFGAALRELLTTVTSGELPTREAPDVLAPNNLPAAATSLIGRARESAEVKRLLLRHRLVTLTGAGGCGKTRLALRVATDLFSEFPDGVWFVELAALSDPRLVARGVASAMGLREEAGRAIVDTVVDDLRKRKTLLVLDNCEHLAEACAALAEAILSSCSACRILATSRAVLGAVGEARWHTPSLSTPPRGDALTPEQALQYEAVRLFVARASVVKPGFALDEQNASSVAGICQELDGIPLAIELAAARMNVLPATQILARLEDRFRLLTGGGHGASARQRTLRATLEWSYGLLSPAERPVFRRLSVFAGGVSLEGAESACTGGDIVEGEVLDLLSRLADQSLVVPEEGARGAARYRLLESIRQYGWERLEESKELSATRDRHASYFATLAARAEGELEGPEQVLWLDRLEEEYDNFRAAIQRALETRNAECGLRLIAGLWRFWWIRGHLQDGRDRAQAVLAMSEGHEDIALRAHALVGAGRLCHEGTDYVAARAFHGEALAIRRSLGDRAGVAMSLVNLGIVVHGQGDLALARRHYSESLTIQEELGNQRGIAISLNNLGRLAAELGQREEAHAQFARSLEIREKLGDRRGMSISLDGLGEVAFQRGDFEASCGFYARSLAIQRDLGDRQGIAESLLRLGVIAAGQGRCDEAQERIREALQSLSGVGDRLRLADALDACVVLAWAEREPERAIRLANAGEAFRGVAGLPRTLADERRLRELLERIESTVGGDIAAAAAAAGRALSPEAAILDVREWLEFASGKTRSPRRPRP